MSYRETLPEGCPPAAAVEVTAERVVFRLVRANPPGEADFISRRAEKPNAAFKVPECQARGLSVFAIRGDCDRALKLPGLQGRLICQVRLCPGAGRIQQTSTPSHHTWWPYADFAILANCTMTGP